MDKSGTILIGDQYFSTCKRCGRSIRGGTTAELGLCTVCLQEEDEEAQPALFIGEESTPELCHRCEKVVDTVDEWGNCSACRREIERDVEEDR